MRSPCRWANRVLDANLRRVRSPVNTAVDPPRTGATTAGPPAWPQGHRCVPLLLFDAAGFRTSARLLPASPCHDRRSPAQAQARPGPAPAGADWPVRTAGRGLFPGPDCLRSPAEPLPLALANRPAAAGAVADTSRPVRFRENVLGLPTERPSTLAIGREGQQIRTSQEFRELGEAARPHTVTTSRAACRAPLATDSRSRGPVGVRAPTEFGFAAALQATSARFQRR